jgi:prepilin-type N-terminal cleavage/methylation domain-containing protein
MKTNAFTLIELLIVSTIILVLVSFSTPLFRKSFSDLELKETASNISKFISYAQQRAIIDRCIYKISFELEKKEYRLFRVSGEGQNLTYNTLKDRFGRVFYIPKSIEVESEFSEILFYPDGHCDIVGLKLTGKNKRVLSIRTTGVLGNVVTTEERG